MLKEKTTLFIVIATFFICTGLNAQSILINGKVLDPKGNPIISASVKVKNSNNGTMSDSLGQFKIAINPNAILLVTAIGYADSYIVAGNNNNLLIQLQPSSNNLKEIIVSHEDVDEDARRKEIAEALNDYLKQEAFRNSTFNFLPSYSASVRQRAVSGTAANSLQLSTINYGIMLPVIEHKEETKGSRYLFPQYAKGLIIDTGFKATNFENKSLNFDKMDGQLMLQLDSKKFLKVDREQVDAFALKTDDTALIFLKVPILSKIDYFILIASGPKYSAYKSVRTKFVKSHYISNGLTEIGNNYDEYVDTENFYWVNQQANVADLFELKKKSLKTLFPSEKVKIDAFFSKHKSGVIDETFVKNLIIFLNQ